MVSEFTKDHVSQAAHAPSVAPFGAVHRSSTLFSLRRILTATCAVAAITAPTAALAAPLEGLGPDAGPSPAATAHDSWFGNLLQETAGNLLGPENGNLLGEAVGNLLGPENGNLLGETAGNLLDEGEEVTGDAGDTAREAAMEGLAIVRKTVWP